MIKMGKRKYLVSKKFIGKVVTNLNVEGNEGQFTTCW